MKKQTLIFILSIFIICTSFKNNYGQCIKFEKLQFKAFLVFLKTSKVEMNSKCEVKLGNYLYKRIFKMKTKLTLYDKLLLIEYSNFKNRERISYEYIKSKSKNIIISKNAYATDLKGINLFAFMYLNINSFGTDSIITNFIIENFTKQNFANFNIETVGNNEIKSYIINLITYANNINNSVISSADIVNFIKLKMLIINKQIAIL